MTTYSQFAQSSKLEKSSLQIKSWTLFLISLLLVGFSLFTFTMLCGKIEKGSADADSMKYDLEILDVRYGYNSDAVLTLFSRW